MKSFAASVFRRNETQASWLALCINRLTVSVAFVGSYLVRDRCCSGWSAYLELGKVDQFPAPSQSQTSCPVRPQAGLFSPYLRALGCLTPSTKINKVPQ